MSTEDLISVIIPVYNAQAYLAQCLDSVFAQSYDNIEVICINDGSVDASEAILKEYGERYPDKMIVKQIPNGGQANARNVGIELAKGAYVMFVDSDDTIAEHMLAIMAALLRNTDSDMAVCDIARVFEGKASLLERRFRYDTPLSIEGQTTIYEHPEIICFLTGAPYAKLIKKQFLDAHRIRFVKGYIYEDQVFTQTILAHHPKMVFTREKLYRYLVRDNSTMTSKKSRVSDMFVSYRNLYEAYAKQGREGEFKQELDYLCLYHVMIGTAYRLWRSGQCGLWKAITQCRAYVKTYQCKRGNPYMKKKGWMSRVYLFLVYR